MRVHPHGLVSGAAAPRNASWWSLGVYVHSERRMGDPKGQQWGLDKGGVWTAQSRCAGVWSTHLLCSPCFQPADQIGFSPLRVQAQALEHAAEGLGRERRHLLPAVACGEGGGAGTTWHGPVRPASLYRGGPAMQLRHAVGSRVDARGSRDGIRKQAK